MSDKVRQVLIDEADFNEWQALKARLGQPAIDALMDDKVGDKYALVPTYAAASMSTKNSSGWIVTVYVDDIRLDKPAKQEG